MYTVYTPNSVYSVHCVHAMHLLFHAGLLFKVNFLKIVPLLSTLPATLLSKVSDVLELEIYKKGDYIVREGTSGTGGDL